MKIKDIQLPADSVQALKSAQKQLQVVERAYERYRIAQAERPLVRSPRLDGMPRGTREPVGLEKRYVSMESYQQRIEQEENRLEQVREEAQRVIYGLPDKVQDFCYWHYIEGMSVQDTAAYIDRDISTCWRYKQVIERNTV